MRIGISVLTKKDQNIWSNGIGQNVIFLAEILKKISFVSSVCLIDVGSENQLPPQVDLKSKGLMLLRPNDVADNLDVIIEMAGLLDMAWLSLMKARGVAVVYMCCGNPLNEMEGIVFDRPVVPFQAGRWDSVWMLPVHRDFVPWMRTLYRCPVYIVPYIWSPEFVEKRIQEIQPHGLSYGYNSEALRTPLKVAIFEPNISVVKNSVIPMLACDAAYKKSRQCIQVMHVLNTLHLKDHTTMLYFANSLELVRDSKALFHGRNDVVGFMSQFANAVVSHQWQNDQNYLYLDILYGDYPLIHNSPWLSDAGYYYPDFDSNSAGDRLINAFNQHGLNLGDYKRKSLAVFKSVDLNNPENISAYSEVLIRVTY